MHKQNKWLWGFAMCALSVACFGATTPSAQTCENYLNMSPPLSNQAVSTLTACYKNDSCEDSSNSDCKRKLDNWWFNNDESTPLPSNDTDLMSATPPSPIVAVPLVPPTPSSADQSDTTASTPNSTESKKPSSTPPAAEVNW